MFPKINVYYEDEKKRIHYLHSTNSRKLVRDAVARAKELYARPMYGDVEAKVIGEPLVLNRIFGRRAE